MKPMLKGANPDTKKPLWVRLTEAALKQEPTMWYVWSMEHGAWWRPNHCGYTTNKQEAGAYTYYEACKIVEGANKHQGNVPNEAMILITP